MFSGLLDEAASDEAMRVLSVVLLDSVFHLSAAMPVALPFLIQLVGDRCVPDRAALVDLLAITAELSQPVNSENDQSVTLLGGEGDHPERAQCRAVFAEYASILHTLPEDGALPDGEFTADELGRLLRATVTH
ncbi:hypothetical protein [Actinomadura sp. HBU206391]|uniref:hypothetical protein n=1 Tax=Actinomadura sp. HBU206391 TaxID=2731692 RepID=UPI0016508B93|nr:hypothetical protein [Actinomadura sp. HBU206391]MBC6462066.1 hypothetical protein [Actinomadura sp. HBU206391]